MKIPRVRITVRSMMILVALVAVGLVVFGEFRDGLPPRFILRQVPGRIARLRPGMTRAETEGILGLNRPWLRGGLGARLHLNASGPLMTYEEWGIGNPRSGVQTQTITISRSAAYIRLRFRVKAPRLLARKRAGVSPGDMTGSRPASKPSAPLDDYMAEPLVGASFGSDTQTIATMPGSK